MPAFATLAKEDVVAILDFVDAKNAKGSHRCAGDSTGVAGRRWRAGD